MIGVWIGEIWQCAILPKKNIAPTAARRGSFFYFSCYELIVFDIFWLIKQNIQVGLIRKNV